VETPLWYPRSLPWRCAALVYSIGGWGSVDCCCQGF
jgi:hypothetical protein